jgi:hypothetical protein
VESTFILVLVHKRVNPLPDIFLCTLCKPLSFVLTMKYEVVLLAVFTLIERR